jgi:Trk K+ transport system NAD-binding subunit
MVVLVLATLTFVFIMGSIAFSLYPEFSYLVTLWYTLNHVIDPGYLFGNEGAEPAGFLLIMTMATFWGILVYSLIISFVSSSFFRKLEELRSGRSPIVEMNHTVILGFNETVAIMLQELTESNLNATREVVVILSDEDPSTVLESVYEVVTKTKQTKVIVRRGSVARKEDLEMVAIGHSKSVIIASQNDISTIKIILALKQSSFFAKGNKTHAVCMIKEYNNVQVVNEISLGKIEVIYLAQLKSKVFARSCLHPGLSSIYKNIFSFVGEEIYFDHQDAFIGKTFQELMLTLEGGSIIGIMRKGKSILNPAMDFVYKQGDQAIIIANDNGVYSITPNEQKDFSSIFKKDPYINTGRKILTIGYNRNVAYVLRDMELYVGENSVLHMIVPNEHNKEKLLFKYPKPKFSEFSVTVGETYKYELLKDLNLLNYDTIAIFANKDVSEESADAETLLTLLHLDTLRKKQKVDPSIVLEIEEPENSDALEYIRVDDFLISNLLVSKIMTQISQNRNLNSVIQELVSEEGNEFYLKRINAYVPVNQSLPFYALIQAAQLRNEVVVGYKRFGKEVILNPSKFETFTFNDKDRLVLVARN